MSYNKDDSNIEKWNERRNPIAVEWKNRHDYEFDYPYNGCLFDKCHQSFINQRDVIFGMVIGGGIQDIKNITDPFYRHKLDYSKLIG